MFREADLCELVVLVVRSGRVVDTVSFSSTRVELPDDEVIAAFLRDHYAEGGAGEAHLPDEVLVPVLPEGADGMPGVIVPRKTVGELRKLLDDDDATIAGSAEERASPGGRSALHAASASARPQVKIRPRRWLSMSKPRYQRALVL